MRDGDSEWFEDEAEYECDESELKEIKWIKIPTILKMAGFISGNYYSSNVALCPSDIDIATSDK